MKKALFFLAVSFVVSPILYAAHKEKPQEGKSSNEIRNPQLTKEPKAKRKTCLSPDTGLI
jgi:hypothetical protein